MTLAHAGHWAISLLYLAPVVLVVGAVAARAWLDRRHAGRERADR